MVSSSQIQVLVEGGAGFENVCSSGQHLSQISFLGSCVCQGLLLQTIDSTLLAEEGFIVSYQLVYRLFERLQKHARG